MGKTKIRLKNCSKFKRWKKGHSCLSNPSQTKYRSASKCRFFQPNIGASYLTEEVIKKHNECEDQDNNLEGDHTRTNIENVSTSDVHSVGGKTFYTWATNWTECSNATFSRVQNYLNSHSALHREILAVLAAVTEVIKQEGGEESNTEYFAVLNAALETAGKTEAITAIVYLLNIIIQRTPVAVLQTQFSTSKKLLNVLAEQNSSNNSSLIKSCLLCLTGLLQVQSLSTWNLSSTRHVYFAILSFITHSKPKVRKTAHQAVKIVLKMSVFMTDYPNPPLNHPVSSLTAKYCLEKIDTHTGLHDYSAVMHILGLVGEILSEFPAQSIKSCCETILRLFSLNNPMVTSCGMRSLYNLFLSKPPAHRLTVELNAKLISALYDHQPSETDVQPAKAWLSVMESSHTHILSNDKSLCLGHSVTLLAACSSFLLSDHHSVRSHATRTAKVLISENISDCIKNWSSADVSESKPVQHLLTVIEQWLGYQYHAAWPLIFDLFSSIFTVFGKSLQSVLIKFLDQIVGLRSTDGFQYKCELDKTVGTAVKIMGPAAVLEAVPLNISGENDDTTFPRSWLMPILRTNIQNTELSFFTSYFLPLALKLKRRAEDFLADGQAALSKTYDILQDQIWSLLPGFCTKPVDLVEAFPALAKVLGMAIRDRPDIRLRVMAALRLLVQFSLTNDNMKSALSRFAKNYLPILFNGFTEKPKPGYEKDKSRLALLQTAKVIFQITDSDLLNSYSNKTLTKLDDATLSPFERTAILDMVIALISYFSTEQVTKVLTFAITNVASDDKRLQKKSYRILEEIWSVDSVQSKSIVDERSVAVAKILVKSLSASHASSKASRLHCLSLVLKKLPKGQTNLLKVALPEAVLCTKAVGERARSASYQLLTEISQYISLYSQKPRAESLQDVVHMVLAGLTGDSRMISATISALTHLISVFADQINSDTRKTLIENVCLLLGLKSKEVFKDALTFITVFIAMNSDVQLSGNLKLIIDSLMSVPFELRHQHRFFIKKIFRKLIKKYSFESILTMCPSSYSRVLCNIRKELARTKKKEARKLDISESHDEPVAEPVAFKPDTIEDILRESESETDEKPDASKTERKCSKSWLKEDQEDIVDFLDPSVSRKISGVRPGETKERTEKSPFKVGPDGRMIITDGEEKSNNKGGETIDDEDFLDDLIESIEAGSRSKSRKRKLSTRDADSEVNSMASSNYKAGGSGIHRNVTSATKRKVQKVHGESSGKQFRAKKAGGDVKTAGNLDPYAYIPLNFNALNKRKQAKLKGQFNNFIKGAKRGAAKGSRSKMKKHL